MTKLNKMLAPWPRHTRPIWLLCMLLVAGAVALAMDAYYLGEEASADQERLSQLHRRAKPRVQPKPSRTELEEQKRWDALRAERSFNWYPIFLALERSSEADIELLEFEPDKAGHRLVLRGEARNADALKDYLERLSSQSSLTQVYLAHEKIQPRDRFSTLTFEIRASIVDP